MQSDDHCRSLLVAIKALVLGFALVGSETSCSAAQPADSVQQFYAKYLEVHKPGGLPSEPELAILRGSFSERLYGLLHDALKYQSGWKKKHPPEPAGAGAPPIIYKPPFIDGEYFADNFEGFKRFEVTKTKPLGDRRWQIVVHFWYEPDSEGWEDSVVVVRENGRYVIDDIIFAGRGEFDPANRLTKLLRRRSRE